MSFSHTLILIYLLYADFNSTVTALNHEAFLQQQTVDVCSHEIEILKCSC